MEHLKKSQFCQNDEIELSDPVNEMPSLEEGKFEKGDFEKETKFCDAKICKNEKNQLGDGWKTEKVLESDGVERCKKDDEKIHLLKKTL